MSLFESFPAARYEGPDSADPLAFRHYDADEMIAGKSLANHLRFAIAYWHSFAWEGGDPFGGRTFDRPWFPQDSMESARRKADAAFELFHAVQAPYFCWHDADLRPEQGNYADNCATLDEITDYIGGKMESSGMRCLWGTANLFSDRRWMSGAASNPDPEVYAFAGATVKACLDATHKLGGENYVLWGGREGYETLLNTDLRREFDHMGRFLNQVVEYKHKIGFAGTILVEPKPQEPTKHQYDFDVATCIGFLHKYGLEDEVKLNIEQGHAILAGHSFEHEIALACTEGLFGSIDMNRNDYQSGWDTDQFPNNPAEVALAYYYIIKGGGFVRGGTNFDAKLRRQSLDAKDLVAAHIGAMDVCARGFKAALAMHEDGGLESALARRYADWESDRAQSLLSASLSDMAERVLAEDIRPEPRSGRQEILENYVNRFV